jgi:hypothetical protein
MANVATLNVNSVSIPGSQPTNGYVMVTNGTTVSWAPPLNLLFTGAGTTKTLTGYVDVTTGVLYAVTSASTASGQLVLNIQEFIPTFSYTINSLSPSSGIVSLSYWDVPVTQFAVTATNTSLQLAYITQISSISSASPGIVDTVLSDYTFSSNDPAATNAKPNVHSYILAWTDTLTKTGSIQSGQTGASGGSASFSVSFMSYKNGNYALWGIPLPISVQWPSITAQNQFSPSLPATLDFLKNYQSFNYSVTYTNYSASPVIDTRIGNGGSAGTSIQSASATPGTLLIAAPYLYKDSSSVTLNLFSNVVFTRLSTVTGGVGYTQNIAYTTLQTSFKPATTYGFFWTQNVAQHVITSSPEVVTGTSWATNDSVLKNTQASLPFSFSATGTSSNPELYIGFTRASGSYSNVTISGATPDYAGTIALRPAGSDVPPEYQSVQYAYYRFYLISDGSISISASTVAPFDGAASILIASQTLTTFLSNISTTSFTSGYNGSFPARLSLALDASTTSGTSFANTLIGTNSNGTITFPNRTLHKNSNYTIKINVGGNFYTADTPQTQSISTSCTFPAQTVTLYPTFYSAFTTGYVPPLPATGNWASVVTGTWLGGNSSLSNAYTSQGVAGTIISGTSSGTPELIIGYSRKNTGVGYSNLIVTITAGSIPVTPDYSGIVNLAPNGTGVPSDYGAETYVYYRYYLPSNSGLTLSTSSGSTDLTTSPAPTLSVAPVSLYNFLRSCTFTTFSTTYSGKFSAVISGLGSYGTPSVNGTLSGTVTVGPTTSGTLTFPGPLYNQNSVPLAFSINAIYQTPEGATVTKPLSCTAPFSATVGYPTFWTQQPTGTTLTSAMVVTGTYAGNNGELVNSYYSGLPTSVSPNSGLQEFYFGYSRSCTTFTGTYDIIVTDQGLNPLTPDYSSNIALQCSDAPTGWKSSNYVYWRYLTNSTSLGLSITNNTATGTPSLNFIQPVASNNFLNWAQSTTGTASYVGRYYGIMTLTNSGQGTLTGTQTGVSNALSLSFGFRLHKSNSFNLSITMNTRFQRPDALGDLIGSTPTGWPNSSAALLSVTYPTFFVLRDVNYYQILVPDIVSGLWSDNSGNFKTVSYNGSTTGDNPWYVIHDDGIYNYGISNGGQDAIVIPARSGSSSRYLWYCYTTSNPVYNSLASKIVRFYGYYTGQYNTGATVTYQGQTTLNFPGTALGTLPSDYAQQVYNIGYIQINDSNDDTHLQIAWS